MSIIIKLTSLEFLKKFLSKNIATVLENFQATNVQNFYQPVAGEVSSAASAAPPTYGGSEEGPKAVLEGGPGGPTGHPGPPRLSALLATGGGVRYCLSKVGRTI